MFKQENEITDIWFDQKVHAILEFLALEISPMQKTFHKLETPS